MPIHFELEADYVRVTCEADFDTAEVRTRCEEIARLHGSKSLLRVLVQDDDANFTPTPEELKAFAAVLSVAYRDVPVRIAVVAGNDVHFGMARLLGAFCEPPAMGYVHGPSRAIVGQDNTERTQAASGHGQGT